MKAHRGRFQAQGKNLEESEAWAQDVPLKIKGGENLLLKLENKLDESDRVVRKKAFENCKLFIQHIANSGGYDVKLVGKVMKKSFVAKGQERVDLEIQSGKAFIL